MMKKVLLLFSALFLLYFLPAVAQPSSQQKEEAYFKAFYAIQQLPEGATPILPASKSQTEEFLQLLAKNNIKNDLFDPAEVKVAEDGHFDDDYGDEYTLFIGDFNNCGSFDYLLVSTGGSMHVDTVMGAWSKSGGQLAQLDFDKDVIDSVLGGSGDISSFYFHIAKPFAYMLLGKTYIRFMQVPEAGHPDDPNYYDVSQLLVCTYFWKNHDFKLVGPQNCIGGNE